ncbi:hypothetical protein AK830_g2149 [Neonectria ditissima]|uniref:Uncharacterized protein n=1 Tax=Neonectria ditissima TaxID=78410 RepID=A0A0P7BWS3_9HYPO|nr:hypothetical protein AK830_g2149 [Neonectria ditissima]
MTPHSTRVHAAATSTSPEQLARLPGNQCLCVVWLIRTFFFFFITIDDEIRSVSLDGLESRIPSLSKATACEPSPLTSHRRSVTLLTSSPTLLPPSRSPNRVARCAFVRQQCATESQVLYVPPSSFVPVSLFVLRLSSSVFPPPSSLLPPPSHSLSHSAHRRIVAFSPTSPYSRHPSSVAILPVP